MNRMRAALMLLRKRAAADWWNRSFSCSSMTKDLTTRTPLIACCSRSLSAAMFSLLLRLTRRMRLPIDRVSPRAAGAISSDTTASFQSMYSTHTTSEASSTVSRNSSATEVETASCTCSTSLLIRDIRRPVEFSAKNPMDWRST